MSVDIRQEINILNGVLSAAGGASATSNEIVKLDTASFNGATFYFEIVADSTVSISFNVTLVGSVDGTVATCNVPLLTTAYTLIRSSSFNPTTANQTYTVVIDNTAGATKNVKSARIIILQSAASITATETQIELGGTSGSTTTSTTNVAITNPKYWKYTSANWDGAKAVFFEAVFKCANSKSATTVTLQVADGTGDGYTGWTDVTSSSLTTTDTVPARVRSSDIFGNLTAGRNYRVVFKSGTSKSAATIYSAKVIFVQTNATDQCLVTESVSALIVGGGTAGSGEATQAAAQSFTASVSYALNSVSLFLQKTGSPTDNYYVEIYGTGVNTTLLGTSNNVAASSVPTAPAYVNFTFATPINLTASTEYWIRLFRTGARDAGNVCLWRYAGDVIASRGQYSRDNNVWSAETAADLGFQTFIASPAALTKFEPQYLLLNTVTPAGTGFQTYLTKWDSTEWSSVTNTYTGQAEAANGSTSVITIQEADGGSTLATISSPDNGGTAAATIPTSQNLDIKLTTNNTDVYAVRLLVAVLITIAPLVCKILVVPQTVKRASFW